MKKIRISDIGHVDKEYSIKQYGTDLFRTWTFYHEEGVKLIVIFLQNSNQFVIDKDHRHLLVNIQDDILNSFEINKEVIMPELFCR